MYSLDSIYVPFQWHFAILLIVFPLTPPFILPPQAISKGHRIKHTFVKDPRVMCKTTQAGLKPAGPLWVPTTSVQRRLTRGHAEQCSQDSAIPFCHFTNCWESPGVCLGSKVQVFQMKWEFTTNKLEDKAQRGFQCPVAKGYLDTAESKLKHEGSSILFQHRLAVWGYWPPPSHSSEI